MRPSQMTMLCAVCIGLFSVDLEGVEYLSSKGFLVSTIHFKIVIFHQVTSTGR